MAWSQRQLNWIEQNRNKIDSGYYDSLENIRCGDLIGCEDFGIILGIAYLRDIPLKVKYSLVDSLDYTTARYQVSAKFKNQSLFFGTIIARINSPLEALKNSLAQGVYDYRAGFPKELFYELVIDRSEWTEEK